MKLVKFLVILPKESDTEQNTTIICEDGGVATLHFNSVHMIADLYQSRLTKDTDLSQMFEILGEGKMYCESFEWQEKVKPFMIKQCIEWLYTSTDEYCPIMECHSSDDIADFDYLLADWLTLNYKQ